MKFRRAPGLEPTFLLEIVFAFSSPCGILPSAMNLRQPERFIVHSAEQAASPAKSLYVTTYLEVNYDGR
jgi:hypothetical protein